MRTDWSISYTSIVDWFIMVTWPHLMASNLRILDITAYLKYRNEFRKSWGKRNLGRKEDL